MADGHDDPPQEGLSLAFDWLQRNLDALTEVTRRASAQTTSASVRPDASPISGPPAARPSQPGVAAPSVAHAPAGDPSGLVSDTPAAPTAAGPRPTPLLDAIGRDLTKLAAEGSLAPVIGREDETAWMIEVLLRSSKRNPVLLGPAGVGKTAIVEGLAQRIVAGRVPEALRRVRIIEVPISSLTTGTQYRGQLEERMTQLVSEASQPSVILFFDEIHLLAGAGRTEGGMGADQVLKPALGRGDLAVIGAATPAEYRTSIAQDAALARRFTTVTVAELDRTATRPILMSVRDGLQRRRGVSVSDEALDVLLEFADQHIVNRRFPDKAIDLLEQAIAHAIVGGRTTVDHDDAVATTALWSERASSTPTLERFGRDLVALAREGKLGPIVGRDRELDAIIEVLLRRTKRNPLLLGPAGSGKTAIVEGLAIRIARGAVPEVLRDVRLFDVPLLSLASGIEADPPLLDDFLMEVRHPSVVVFFDEIHLLTAAAVRDLAQSLKPSLARGEIACIGATTSEEYQAGLESETALARRFTEIPVAPMDDAAVHVVLVAVRDRLADLRKVTVTDEALAELTNLADQYLPNRSFPDKGVDLIEQAVAYALTHERRSVDVATAREAVAQMIGMPLDPTEPLRLLGREVREHGLLDASAAGSLLARLSVSLRGLDARRDRPDAVIMLCDGAVTVADPLATAVARALFGRATARVDIDLTGMTEEASMSTLLGSAPGLIGSDRPLPLHELRRSPWQVLLLRGIDACAIGIRETIANGLASGSLTDAMGRRIPLGSAVVIMTAPVVSMDGGPPTAAVLASRLGETLAAACDVITGIGHGAASDARAAWITRELLDPLATRFARAGYRVSFDPSFVAWLGDRLPDDGEAPEAYLDRDITPLLVGGLPTAPGPVTVHVVDDQPAVVPDPVSRERVAPRNQG
jgi:ATP-dependent Clp protease ATP-binding subunit ClpC